MMHNFIIILRSGYAVQRRDVITARSWMKAGLWTERNIAGLGRTVARADVLQ